MGEGEIRKQSRTELSGFHGFHFTSPIASFYANYCFFHKLPVFPSGIRAYALSGLSMVTKASHQVGKLGGLICR